jgi:hypothetical protein
MIDINLIRENKDLVKENIKKKFQEQKLYLVDEIFELDVTYRQTKKEADDLRSQKNQLSDQIGLLMREGKKAEAETIKGKVATNNEQISALEAKEIIKLRKFLKKHDGQYETSFEESDEFFQGYLEAHNSCTKDEDMTASAIFNDLMSEFGISNKDYATEYCGSVEDLKLSK